MDNTTISAKTYDEAITKALIELQTTSDHLIVETIQEGTSGFLGMIGGKPWIIRARVKTEEEEAREEAEKAAAEKAERDRKAAEKAAAEKAEREKKAAEKAAAEKAEREKKAAEKAAADKAAAEKAAAEKAAKAAAKKPAEASAAEDAPAKNPEKKPRRRGDKKDGSRKKESDRPARQPKDAEAPRRRKEETVGREVFEDEANEIKAKAVAFLNDIFRVMEEEIEIDTDFNYQDNELGVSLSGGDMGVMIGKRGQTLDSLQYLVSLVVNKHRDVYIRVKLDTENYRERREQKLKSLARNIAHKVKKTRKPVSLEPMNPYERRIIHSALQRDPYVTTYSEGEDPYRHIVVTLKKNPKKDRPFRKRSAAEEPQEQVNVPVPAEDVNTEE